MSKRIIVLLIACAMALSLSGCGKTPAVKETERLIAAIGDVTADSVDAVEAAEEAYQALSEQEKADVKNHADLEAARTELDALLLDALRTDIVGTWVLDMDVTEILAEKISPQFANQGISFGDYLEPCALKITLTLLEDGVFRLTVDDAAMEQTQERLLEAARTCTEEYMLLGIAATLQETGVEGDFTTREGIEAAIGMPLDELLQSSLGMGLDDYAARTVEDLLDDPAGRSMEGSYEVQPEQLILSNASNPDDPEGNMTAAFTLAGDELTLQVEPYIFDLTSLVFHRAVA